MKTEIYPHRVLGVVLVGLSILNLFQNLGLWLDKIFWAIMLFVGIRLLRKRIVVTNENMEIVGLVKGKPRVSMRLEEILSIRYNKVSSRTEIATENQLHTLVLNDKQRARLKQALAPLHVTVQE